MRMGDEFGFNFGEYPEFENGVITYAGYFNAVELVNDSPSCIIPVKVSAITSFNSNQTNVDMLGDVLYQEAEKLREVADTINYLEDTLSTLYQQG